MVGGRKKGKQVRKAMLPWEVAWDVTTIQARPFSLSAMPIVCSSPPTRIGREGRRWQAQGLEFSERFHACRWQDAKICMQNAGVCSVAE